MTMRQSHASARVHLDTDLGGDPDDACALAMLLGWPGVEIAAITTTIDPGGQRAACVSHCLTLAGRQEVPVVAGEEASLTTRAIARPATTDERYWPDGIAPTPSPPGAAVEMLARSVRQGLTVIAIGPLTNLAQLERARPGCLGGAHVVAMGGWIDPPADGLPPWRPERDWNVQWDTHAAQTVAAAAGDLTLAPLPVTLEAHLRERDLPRLHACGPLGALLARQSEARRDDLRLARLARSHAGLPDDLVNFHHDPVTCAVALGWQGAAIEEMRL
ncbi:MAG: nucleoside hydrolase [Solirubrobacteraceae bacterium MAG38_C4-C5]|nr:nucleoside hydrolase [Candidatus Siliceabacter maunaloa]